MVVEKSPRYLVKTFFKKPNAENNVYVVSYPKILIVII